MAGKQLGSRQRLVALAVLVLTPLVLMSRTAGADEVQWSGDPIGFDGPYCGLYAMYAAARLNGMPSSPAGIRPLLKPEYIGSRAGASTEELEAAAEAFDMNARTVSGLTRLDLMALTSPAILHVKSHPSMEFYDHWVLLVSCDATEAVLIDEGPSAIREPIGSLASRWDGTAVVVSADPVPNTVRLPTVVAASATVLLLLSGAFIVRHAVRPVGRCSLLREAIGMSGLAAVIGAVWAGVDRNQPVWASPARQAVIDRHLDQFLPSVSIEQMKAWTSGHSDDVIVVDSRSTDDYKAGHIPGARSVPVYATDNQLRELIDDLGDRKRLVIYCQSRQCSFSAMLAARLRGLGFMRLAIYHDGWIGWEEASEAQNSGRSEEAGR